MQVQDCILWTMWEYRAVHADARLYTVNYVGQGSTLRVNLWPQASENSQKQFRASKKRLQLVLQAQ